MWQRREIQLHVPVIEARSPRPYPVILVTNLLQYRIWVSYVTNLD